MIITKFFIAFVLLLRMSQLSVGRQFVLLHLLPSFLRTMGSRVPDQLLVIRTTQLPQMSPLSRIQFRIFEVARVNLIDEFLFLLIVFHVDIRIQIIAAHQVRRVLQAVVFLVGLVWLLLLLLLLLDLLVNL